MKENFTLHPGDFILASTKEKLFMSRDLIGFLDGRSTIARIGLTVHVASTTADGHYDEPRAITLEIANIGDLHIKLAADYPIGMITFAKLEGTVTQAVKTRYQGQQKATPPNLLFKTGEDE